jgi:hypothetical protein
VTELFDPHDTGELVALLRRHLEDPEHHRAQREAVAAHRGPRWSDTTVAVAAALGDLVGPTARH